MGLSDAIRDRAMAISENRDIKNLFSGRQANVGAAVVLAFAAGCEKYYLNAVNYAQVGECLQNDICIIAKSIFKIRSGYV